MAQEKLFFMHIPKTAGTSFRYVLEREYRGSLGAYYPPNLPEQVPATDENQAVTGHFKVGFHKPLHPAFCTFLREPVAQVISHFRHIQSSNHPDHAHLKGLDLVAFSAHPFAANIQTRYILGRGDDAVQLQDADGQKAFEQLRDAFLSFGIQEHFDKSILLLARKFNWKRPFYLHINASRGEKVNPSPEEIRAIAKNNAADIHLYYAALNLFNERWKGYPLGGLKLQAYRLINRLYAWLNPAVIWWKQRGARH